MSNLISDIDVLIPASEAIIVPDAAPRTSPETSTGKSRKLYIESYGCQMNFSDSEIVTAIMQEQGFDTTSGGRDSRCYLFKHLRHS